MNELTLNVKQNPGVIELNFDEIEKALDAKLAEYKGAVFTEESKSIAKSEVANLRKLKKDFEDARKGVKKEWMKPYEDFEAKMKNLTEKIDEPICLIDSQLKDFERKRREERREKIKEIYQEIIGDMEEYCDLGRIYDTKWENATTTMRSIRESIATAVESARIAVSTISGMQSDAVEKALEIYKDSQDMAKAVAYINNYEQQKAEIMRREARLMIALADRAEELGVKVKFNTILRAYKKVDREMRKKSPSLVENWTNFEGPYDNMRCGLWIASDHGIYAQKEGGLEDVACYHPILPIERLKNLETGDEQLKLAFKRNNRWEEIIVPKDLIATAGKITALSKRGVAVTSENAKLLVRFLSDVENFNDNQIQVQYSTSKLGWIKSGFIPYDTEIVFDGDSRFTVSVMCNERAANVR